MKKTFVIRYVKRSGKLIPKDSLSKIKLKEYIDSISENDIIDVLFEADEPNNTKSQLAKVHVMINAIANETGEDVKKTKIDIKDQCGLTYYQDQQKKFKSFADLSRTELSDVIEKLYLVGEFVGINFQKDL